MASYLGKSLALLRSLGYCAESVERWLPKVERRRDRFQFADALAVHDHREPRFLPLHTTSIGNLAARLAKLRSRVEATVWLRAGGTTHLHGWECRGGRWHVKVVEIRPQDMAAVVISGPKRRGPHKKQVFLFD